MITFTKEQLIASAHARIEFAEMMLAGELEPLKERTWSIELELARIALASLETEPVCVIDQSNLDYLKSGADADVWPASRTEMGDVLLYRAAPPAPVSVPDEDLLHMAASAIEDLLSNKDRYCAGVWADIPAKLRRAAMLQGDEGTIPAMLFKPVADLYGLTSPTGGETSFTFDAVEARDFIDGGWSCQEYVELERFQEAITNHTEDKLAMVDHSGDSNNMVEPVTTAYKLPDDFDFDRLNDVVWLEAVASNPHMHSLTTSTIAMVALELNRKLADCNSPVIPDGWKLVPVEPTEHMIVEGFESEPYEFFSDAEVWEAYDAMSGCQQAAHRAKLCWAAMIAAAPKLE